MSRSLASLSIAWLAVGLVLCSALPVVGLDQARLWAVRDGFASRRDQAIQTQAGETFRPAKKNAPLAPGRAPYVRGYAWSVTDFVLKSFWLNESPEPANAALRDLCQYFAAEQEVRNGRKTNLRR